MKIIDQNGEVLFRGEVKAAKAFYGNGTFENEVYNEETDTVEAVEVHELTMVYEEPADDMQYLADTDWYVVREQETGKPMPVEVRAKRSAIRART